MQRLRIGLRRFRQPRQRLAFGFGEQPEMQRSELLEVADVGEERSILRTVLIHEGHRMGCFPHLGHGAASFRPPLPADCVPNMTKEGLVPGQRKPQVPSNASWTREQAALRGHPTSLSGLRSAMSVPDMEADENVRHIGWGSQRDEIVAYWRREPDYEADPGASPYG